MRDSNPRPTACKADALAAAPIAQAQELFRTASGSRTADGEVSRYKYEPVQLELMGRKENFDVIEVPESVPNLLGQVPLEVLDFVVDGKGQKLIPNPAHGGEQMTEEF